MTKLYWKHVAGVWGWHCLMGGTWHYCGGADYQCKPGEEFETGEES